MHLSRLRTALIVGGLLAAAVGMFGRAQSQQQSPGGQAQNPAGGRRPDRYPKVNVAVGYRFVEGWPQKPAEAVWGAMSSLAIDASGNIWTFNRGNIPIQVYRPDGTLVRMWGGGGVFKSPHTIRLDKEGNVWATDREYHTATKFTPDGKALMTIGVKGEPGEDDRHLNQPTDVAITPAGDLFISDGHGNNRVVHYDKNGKFVKSWGRLGSGPGEFSILDGIVVDSKGRLYVADRNNARVQVFEQSGKYVTEWRNIIVPWVITITPRDEVYVGGSTAMQWWETTGGENGVPPKDQIVVRFDTDGRVQQLWSFPKGPEGQTHKPGELTWVSGIAVAANGDLYLGDITGKSAQKFARVEPDVPPPPTSTSR